MWASMEDSKAAVEVLLEYKADTEAKDNVGASEREYAAFLTSPPPLFFSRYDRMDAQP